MIFRHFKDFNPFLFKIANLVLFGFSCITGLKKKPYQLTLKIIYLPDSSLFVSAYSNSREGAP